MHESHHFEQMRVSQLMIWLGWKIDRLQANPNMQSMENIVAEKHAQLPQSVTECMASH